MTAQEWCEKYEKRAVMVGYKDKSTSIQISKDATFEDVIQLVLEIFGKEK